jgi:hypothetical protein
MQEKMTGSAAAPVSAPVQTAAPESAPAADAPPPPPTFAPAPPEYPAPFRVNRGAAFEPRPDPAPAPVPAPVQEPAPAPPTFAPAPPDAGDWSAPAEDEQGRNHAALHAARTELEWARSALASEKRAREQEEQLRIQQATELEEYRRKRDEEEFAATLKSSVTELTSVDPDDVPKIARPIYDKVLEASQARYLEMERRLDEQRRLLETRERESAAARDRASRDEFYRKLYSAVPDLERLTSTPEYARFMRAPHVAGSKTTNMKHLNHELSMGNYGYVIDRMRQFAQGGARPAPADIAQVATATVGDRVAPVAEPTGKKEPLDSLRARVDARRTGKIKNVADYRAKKYGTGARPPAQS